MITFNEALSLLRKEVGYIPTLYEEYKDRYRFVFMPDDSRSERLSSSKNVDI